MIGALQIGLGRQAATSASYSVTSNIFNIRYATTGLAYTESNALVTWSSGVGDKGAILIVPKGPSTSLWALEFEIVALGTSAAVGIMDMAALNASNTYFEQQAAGYVYSDIGNKINNSSSAAYGDTFTTGDKVTIVLDARGATASLSFAKNGTDQGVAYSGLSGFFIPVVELASGSTTSVRVSSTLTYPLGTQWR